MTLFVGIEQYFQRVFNPIREGEFIIANNIGWITIFLSFWGLWYNSGQMNVYLKDLSVFREKHLRNV